MSLRSVSRGAGSLSTGPASVWAVAVGHRPLFAACLVAALAGLGCSSSGLLVPKSAGAADANQCGAWMEQYNLVPFKSWGSTPGDVQQVWDASDCNHKVCQYMADKYGVVPNQTWGRLPGNLTQVWDTPEVNCNVHVTVSPR